MDNLMNTQPQRHLAERYMVIKIKTNQHGLAACSNISDSHQDNPRQDQAILNLISLTKNK